MASPVLATYQSSTATNSSSIVVSFPASLAEGDWMQIELAWFDYPSGAKTVTTPSGWNRIEYTGSSENGLVSYVKEATAADVSAGSVTINMSASTSHLRALCMRITGSAAGSERSGSEQDSGSLPHTTAIIPDVNETLVILSFFFYRNTSSPATGAPSLSDYTTTPTVTFTEIHDVNIYNPGGESFVFGVAYGTYSGSTQFTSRSVTVNNVPNAFISDIVIWNAPQSASGTNALLSVSPTFFTQNGTAAVIGTNDLLSVSPHLPAQSGRLSTPTQWTNEDKPTDSVWSNEDKP